MRKNTNHGVVELEQVSFTWPGNQTPTLNIDSLSVQEGEHLFIKGPSGCGKSTLLGLLTGIQTIDTGKLSVLGEDLVQMSGSQRDTFRANNIGYIFQQFNLLPYLSVIENVTLPCQFSKLRKSKLDKSMVDEAKDLLNSLHLPSDLMHKPVVELSIGQQQRVAAARALIGKPALIIADEPTSSLDYDNRSAFIELLMDQVKQAQASLLFVSHDPTLESMFDRTLHLNEINRAGVTS
ncbi:ABC transporter ATP-binding protein [Vibrio sp. Of14-4]|uniref:ATP-binding cassette domain-containing protein n=1 Tax=Vibrio tetraodonis subsp. pristinus TaxID=2695891 RepID=A0A6L8M053_9VIBR|nr:MULTISPECIES: ABC transporter ATP-binding protein [Vibrio]MCG7491497.1 ABC transporter ATP-binding protein [Vibrio sp. Of14-4]MYM61093.1 ATP-binding cassette domain-containing protein [Vibrio tetraodonis subsp. pristinus]